MSIDVTLADDDALAAWDDWLTETPQASVFHRLPVLEAIEASTDATLYPLVGYKGQEPVGLFPAFEVTKGPVSTVFSPPPGLGLPYMGPIQLNHEKLKQRKRERRNRRFVEQAFEWLDDRVDQRYTHVVTPPAYDDVRPFQWNEFDVSPRYTYEVDLSQGRDALLASFSSDPRGTVRKTDPDRYAVVDRGIEGVEYVVDRVNGRHDETDGGLQLSTASVERVVERLPDADTRVYEARVDGQRVSGRIALYFDDTVTLWQGAPKPDRDVDVQINDLLMWETFTDAIDSGLSRCDFVGANTPRLCRYKAKFNPDPTGYFEIERGTRMMNAASSLYRRLQT